MSYQDFDTFKNHAVITAKLVNTSNMHIGGIDQDDNLNRIIRINHSGNEIPFIPGSSLKGMLRSEMERHARGMEIEICDSSNPKKVCDGKNNSEYCLICGIFGGAGLAAHVKLEDGMPIGEISTSIKPSAPINRVTGTSANFFNTEVVDPFQEFSFKAVIDNIPLIENDGDQRGQLIKLMLRNLLDGNLSVGGKVTSGMGNIKFEDMKVLIQELDSDFTLMDKQYSVTLQAGAMKFTLLEEAE